MADRGTIEYLLEHNGPPEGPEWAICNQKYYPSLLDLYHFAVTTYNSHI